MTLNHLIAASLALAVLLGAGLVLPDEQAARAADIEALIEAGDG